MAVNLMADPMTQQTAENPKSQQLIVCCVAFAAFVFQFEAFLVNVSLPTIATDLKTTTTHVSFVVIVYLLAATSAFLPAGRLGQSIGLKTPFLGGCFLITVGTLFSGISPNLWTLLASRFLQGLGAGAMAALAYAMIPAWIKPDRVGWGYGYLNLGAGVGMLVGVPLGGMLSHFASWRWIFLSNFPFMLMLLLFAWRILPADRPDGPIRNNVDPLGTVLFSALISVTVFWISLGSEMGWGSAPIFSAFLAAVTLALAMVIRRKLTGRTCFPPGLLSIRGFAASLAVLFLVRMIAGGTIFLLPFYLEVSCGMSAMLASWMLLSYPLVFVIVAPLAGRLADRFDARTLVVPTTLLGAIACGFFALFLPMATGWVAIMFLFAFGLVMGIFPAPNNRFSMDMVPVDRKTEAAALLPVALNMGTIFGVSVFETIFAMRFPGGSAYLKHLQLIPAANVLQLIDQGFAHAFMLAFSIFLIAGIIAWITYRTPQPEQGSSR
jgi:MFS family permease